MTELVRDMVQDDPARRPTIDVVVQRFAGIKKALPWWKLRSRLVEPKERLSYKIWHHVKSAARALGYLVTFRPAIPSL